MALGLPPPSFDVVSGLINYLQESFILYCSALIPHTPLRKISNKN